MNLIFMGTPQFAVPSLKRLLESAHTIQAVVTGPDKQRGRGWQVTETPVKKLARAARRPILQPQNLHADLFIDQLKQYNPTLLVVVAFRILPRRVLEVPRLGAVNLHASLLPKYRGAAPINWAIIKGEEQTGITIFQIHPKVDTGDILYQQKVKIGAQETYGELYLRLAEKGAGALVKVLDDLETDRITARPQEHAKATAAPKIKPAIGKIDWSQKAAEIKNLIHGLSPSPGAHTFFKNKRLKILRAEVSAENKNETPGTIVVREKKRLGIQTGDGILYPLEIQKAGKKALKITAFLNGFQGNVGDKFTS